MRRSTLDVIFSIGGLLLAALLLVLGLVMQNQANFAKNYVTDQLSAQKIVFTSADKLTDEEKQATCLVKYAGRAADDGIASRVLRQQVHRVCTSARPTTARPTHETSNDSRAAAADAKAGRGRRRANAAELTGQRHGPRRQGADAVPRRDAPRSAADLVRLQHLR